MNAALKTLNAQLDEKVKEAEAHYKTVNTEADPDKAAAAFELAKNATADVQTIKSKIETLREAEVEEAQLAGMKNWATQVPATPRNTQIEQPNPTGSATKANVGTTEIDVLTGDIVQETGAGVLSGQQLKMVHNPDYTKGFNAWARAGGDESKMTQKGATKAETGAFLEGSDDEGGHFVPAEVVAGIIKRDPTPTRIVDYVRTIGIGSDRATMVRANYDSDDLYSSAVRIYKTGEAQAAKKSDKPQFGTLNIDVHGWTGEVSISNRFLEDTNFDFMGYLTEEFRTAHRNMIAQKILLGSGVGEHHGLLTRAGQAGKGPDIVKSGHASQLLWDSLRTIKNQVPEQYDTNCRWFFNKKSVLDTIESFKDADNRDLWPESQRAGGESGAPGRLRGYQYVLESFMPDIAANAISLLFGDPRGYARIFRAGMSIKVLKEIEARNSQTVFLVEMREGGDVIEPWRMKALKIAA